ncbi:MAG: TetR/AcrR family transcriptional regulator [bacterium]|nr:TetR/AcrR family transcriptional regulator [bacterium]
MAEGDKPADKRGAILDAALGLIAERGFHNTPVSMIVDVSGVSAGIIYHYFDSKDELILELYRAVKLDMLQSMTDGYSNDLSYRGRFDLLWGNAVRHVISHPDAAAFLEQFESSSYMEPTLPEECVAEIDLVMGFFADGVAAGALKDLPTPILLSLSMGVAASLVKQHLAETLVFDDDLSAAAADACWDAISA